MGRVQDRVADLVRPIVEENAEAQARIGAQMTRAQEVLTAEFPKMSKSVLAHYILDYFLAGSDPAVVAALQGSALLNDLEATRTRHSA